MNTDTSLVAFKAISSFINDLSDVFGDDQRSLKLYAHLISKTTLAHEIAITKHIDVFRDFCVKNRISIEANDKNLNVNIIQYSDKVQIDMMEIFTKADKSTTKVIWKHLLIISAILDTAGQARKILKESAGSGGEADFLSNIIEKIEKSVDPNADPMTAIASIMSSGVFTDLISGMGTGLQDGSLNIDKLMGSVQKMVSKMDGGSKNDNPEVDVSGLLNIMKTQSGIESGAPPDINALLGPMMNMLKQKSNPESPDDTFPDVASMLATMMSKSEGAPPDMASLLASTFPGSQKSDGSSVSKI